MLSRFFKPIVTFEQCCQALISNDLNVIKRFVIQTSSSNKDCELILILAVFWAPIDTVTLLLTRSDIDINAVDLEGNTALIMAAKGRDAFIVKLLLTRSDLDVNAVDKVGNSAFFWAINCNEEKIVALLLQRPAIDLTLTNIKGDTALILAVRKHRTLIVKEHLLPRLTLIDLAKTNHKHENALNKAITKGFDEIAKLIEFKKQELLAELVNPFAQVNMSNFFL